MFEVSFAGGRKLLHYAPQLNRNICSGYLNYQRLSNLALTGNAQLSQAIVDIPPVDPINFKDIAELVVRFYKFHGY